MDPSFLRYYIVLLGTSIVALAVMEPTSNRGIEIMEKTFQPPQTSKGKGIIMLPVSSLLPPGSVYALLDWLDLEVKGDQAENQCFQVLHQIVENS